MPAFQTVVERRTGDDMPKVIRVELPEGKEAVGWAWPNDSIRWHTTYRSRWFDEFQERWQRDCRIARDAAESVDKPLVSDDMRALGRRVLAERRGTCTRSK